MFQTSCEAAMYALVDSFVVHKELLLCYFDDMLDFLGKLIIQVGPIYTRLVLLILSANWGAGCN